MLVTRRQPISTELHVGPAMAIYVVSQVGYGLFNFSTHLAVDINKPTGFCPTSCAQQAFLYLLTS